ncbi:TetR/AcrR family transcriptional regulator [Streptomyces flavalbus]|uniref:TetR/AcrR family transcriptional regulator n=1 Tax=Streptomyces flavalbus TaxID=2665155 RepID=A0ABW2W2M6_9ACTN
MASTTRRPSSAADRRAVLERRISSVIEDRLRRGASYTELSVGQIAHAAGISRSTFYLYFRDKTDVLLRLSDSLRKKGYEIAASWRPTGPGGGLDGLARTYERVLRHYRAHVAVLTAVNEVAAYDPLVHDAWLAAEDRCVDDLVTVLEEERRAGRTPTSVDPTRTARLIVHGSDQALTRQAAHGDATDDPAVATDLARTYWYGVYRRPGEGG